MDPGAGLADHGNLRPREGRHHGRRECSYHFATDSTGCKTRMSTLLDKIWARHCVLEREDGQTLLYVERHYLHDGSSAAFEILRYSFGRNEEAARIERAVRAVLAAGCRTADIHRPGMKRVGTEEMGAAVVAALRR